MKPSEYIRKGWARFTLALDENDSPVAPTNPAAVRWDMTGAIYAAYDDEDKCQSLRTRIEQYADEHGLFWDTELRTLEHLNDGFMSQKRAIQILEAVEGDDNGHE